MAKKKNKSYLSQVATVAPAFGVKALIGDLPKGGIEKIVEKKLQGSKTPLKTLAREGFKGRGTGRALGAGIGIASAPLFLGGLALMSSKKDSDKVKGMALLASSAAGYQGLKGFTEAYREARVSNLPKAKAISEGLRLGTIRLGYKTPAAIALGLSVAAGRKKSKDGKRSKAKVLLAPALGGAAIGALSRGGEGLVKDMSYGNKFSKSLKNIAPRAGAGAAGGLLGGLVLGGVIDHAIKKLEKKGSVEDMEKNASATAHLLALPAIHAATKAGFGYGRIGQALSKMPGLGRIVKASERAKQKQLAIGLREGIAGRTSAGFRTSVLMNMAVPELKMQRELGIKAGKMLRGLPPEMRGQALDAVAAAVRRNPLSRHTKSGDPVAVINQIPGAVDMAMGRKSLGGNKILNSLIYGGRGGLGKGLPVAGRQDRASKGIFSKDNIADMLSTTAGVTGLAGAAAAGGPLGLALGGLGGHMALSGSKNILAKSQLVKDQALRQGSMGIREAFFPGMSRSLGQRAGDQAMDILISPSSRDFGRMMGGIGRGVAQEGRRALSNAAFQKYVNRAAGAHKTGWKDTVTPSVLTGAGLAGLHNISTRNKR